MSTAAAIKAKEILASLADGRDFSIPNVDLGNNDFQFPSAEEMYKSVDKLTVEELTTGEVEGNGIFDKLMSTISKHVEHEYEENRITGAEYSTTYIAAIQSALGYGVQFLLNRDASYWQAQQAQLQAISARVELETAKVRHALMYIEANTAEANFGLTTMRLANEDVTYDTNLFRYEKLMPLEEDMSTKQIESLVTEIQINQYRLNEVMPVEKSLLDAQTTLTTSQDAGVKVETGINEYRLQELLPTEKLQLLATIENVEAEVAGKVYTNTNMLPVEKEILDEQVLMAGVQRAGTEIQNDINTYTNSNILPEQWALLQEQVSNAEIEGRTGEYNLANTIPQQLANLQEQEKLISEQMEAQRAQTLDTRTDNASVSGSVGKQKDLYNQQIDSYQRDAELKAAKVFSDAWTVMKTVDESLPPPDSFANDNLQSILNTIKQNNNLG